MKHQSQRLSGVAPWARRSFLGRSFVASNADPRPLSASRCFTTRDATRFGLVCNLFCKAERVFFGRMPWEFFLGTLASGTTYKPFLVKRSKSPESVAFLEGRNWQGTKKHKILFVCCFTTDIALRPQIRREYPLNLSISLSGGKETN